jgi:hypothetical protein
MANYIVITKVSREKYIRHHVSNLVNFTAFLDRSFQDWRYMNVFNEKTKKQITSFTKNNRPQTPKIS